MYDFQEILKNLVGIEKFVINKVRTCEEFEKNVRFPEILQNFNVIEEFFRKL